MYNPYSLEGKKILVTGASSGIGRATAIECSRLKAQLIITARRQAELEETLQALEGEGHQMIVADLSDEEGRKGLIEALPQIDGFVSNAGIARPSLLQFAEESDINDIMAINVQAPILLTRSLIQKKKLARNASVVYTSSISGKYCSSIGSSLYSASKAAIDGFIKGIALELAPKKIRVNAVNPGVVKTAIFDASAYSEGQLEEEIKRYPLKRYGEPEDVALAIVYLLSNASSWVTGSNLVIDGGYTLL